MFSGLLDIILVGVCTVLFFICSWLLRFIELVETFFNVFAGTEKILYGDEKTYLINIFFGHDAVTNAFWAMAIIAMILCIGFTIVALARKITDVTGTAKHTVGQIVSNFVKSMLVILTLNMCVVAAINVSNVVLDQIDFALNNAGVLHVESGGREVDEAEYAAMTRILATVANYNVNKGSEMRYNINACFNAIRTDLQALQSRGFFEYEYAMTPSGKHTWQTALAYAASAADLTVDLNLNQYYPQVDEAITLLVTELNTNPEFKPVKVGTKEAGIAPNVKVLLFLVSSFGAEHNTMYKNGSMDDALRRGYLNETKDCTDMSTVKKDFDITGINYILLVAGSFIFLMLMLSSIIQFIERLFNLVLLYITGPLFASSMSLDEGGKFQSWLQGFVLQLLGAFGTVFVMRIYLIIMPVMSSKALVFFPNVEGFWGTTINYMAQLILIIGGAFAVSKANTIINGALSGNSAMAAGQQLAEANALGSAGAKGAASMAKKGAAMAATGGLAALKMAADPVNTAKRAGGAVAGAAVGAYQGVKKAFQSNETIGLIGQGIHALRNRPRARMGGVTSMTKDKTAQGNREHSGGFGKRPQIPIVSDGKRRSKEAPASTSSRPTLESMTREADAKNQASKGNSPEPPSALSGPVPGGSQPPLPKQMPRGNNLGNTQTSQSRQIAGGNNLGNTQTSQSRQIAGGNNLGNTQISQSRPITGGNNHGNIPKQMPGGKGNMPRVGKSHEV